MIYVIINAYGEPKSTERAINCFLKQNIKDIKIIVVDPFPEVREYIKGRFKGNKHIGFFLDPGEGKNYSINLILNNLYSNDTNDIIIFTDGDVYVDNNSVNEILKLFKDPKIGCVSGRPVSINNKNNFFGYISHFLCDIAAHEISRKKKVKKEEFLEASGYLFAIRNGIIKRIPLDIAEDSIIPYLFWKKGYKIGYAENALVYVKWPDNLNDWLKQKKRTANSHSKLKNYAPDFPKVKSFYNEIFEGISSFKEVWSYPKNLKEFFYTIMLYPLRLYMWVSLYKDLITRKREYKDGWREDLEVESTKTLD